MASKCTECLACTSTCPVNAFDDTYYLPAQLVKISNLMSSEKYGWNEMLRSNSSFFKKVIYDCAYCLKCNEVCPQDIQVTDLVQRMREYAVKVNVGPLHEHKDIIEAIAKTGMISSKVNTPLLHQVPEIIKVKKPSKRVGLFVGCIINNFLPKIGLSAIKVLARTCTEVVIPHQQRCCFPYYLMGVIDEVMLSQVKRNVKVFKNVKVKTVVTLCPTCGMMLKKIYPKILGKKLDFEILDINEFLIDEVDLNDNLSALPMRVTYHDPCHLRRGQGIVDEPRKLIKMIPEINFREMDETDTCCGGFLRVGRYHVSRSIGERKIDNVLKVKPDILVTSCPTCTIQLLSRLKLRRSPIQVMNVVELIEKSTTSERGKLFYSYQ